MSNRFPLGMAEATRLTRAGDLMGATALIQRLLQGGDVPEPAHTGSGSPTIIDVEPVVLDDTDTQPTARPSATAAQPASEFAGKFYPKPRAGLAETLRDLAAKHMPAGLDIGGLAMDWAVGSAASTAFPVCAPFPSLCPKAPLSKRRLSPTRPERATTSSMSPPTAPASRCR